jgi:hypothetical protein
MSLLKTLRTSLLNDANPRAVAAGIKEPPWIPPYAEFVNFLNGGVLFGRHRLFKRLRDGKLFDENGKPLQ